MPGNAAIVRRGYEAFGTGNLKTLTELLGDDVSWHTPGGAGSPATSSVGRPSSPVSAATWSRRAARSGPT